jgi:hypothetical protein
MDDNDGRYCKVLYSDRTSVAVAAAVAAATDASAAICLLLFNLS